ncbi:MAG: ATP synthase F0 subunit B [Planctomycetota bacterium]|nr:MAG: ATP synthase F0 subunit B [Planctomycetota bacterium]
MSSIPGFALILAAGDGGGFNVFDPSGIGGFFWTLVIFLLSLPVMWKFVFGPITSALRERDERAEAAIGIAKEAKDAAEKAKAESEKALATARAESAKQIQVAREQADALKAELESKARSEIERERASARAEIEAEKEKALAEIRELVVDLSLDATSKLLKREVNGDDQRKLVEGFLGDLDARKN